MDFVKELQDLTYLDWADTKMSAIDPAGIADFQRFPAAIR